jgi:hypothetical protein
MSKAKRLGAFTKRGAEQMKSLEFGRCALSIGVVAAMLAGCGGSQPPIGAPGAMPQSRARALIVARL